MADLKRAAARKRQTNCLLDTYHFKSSRRKSLILVSRAGFEAEGYSDKFQIVDSARSQKNAGMVEHPFAVTPQSRSSR
jgi:hypothetical protein